MTNPPPALATIATTRVSIRFFGDELNPAELSALLGAEPTTHYRRGDVRTSKSGQAYTRRTGAWVIAATERSPGAIDEQLAELFESLTQDLSVWLQLASRFDADVFCGLFMEEGNEGFSLRPETLNALGDRRLQIGFDIYDPDREEQGNSRAPRSGS